MRLIIPILFIHIHSEVSFWGYGTISSVQIVGKYGQVVFELEHYRSEANMHVPGAQN